jgi:hypothetical protein
VKKRNIRIREVEMRSNMMVVLSCLGNLKQRVMEARDNFDLTQKDPIASFGRADCLLNEREYFHACVSITKAE